MNAEWMWVVLLAVKVTGVLGVGGAVAAGMVRASAAWRHAVWTAAVGGALLLPVVAAVVPRVEMVPVWPAREAAPTRMDGGVLPVEAAGLEQMGAKGGAPAAVEGRAVNVAVGVPEKGWSWGAIVGGVYVMGVGVMLLPLVLAGVRRRRQLCGAAVLESAEVEGVREEMGVGRGVKVVCGAGVGMRAVVGILRPRIVLPAAARGWSQERLRTVLLHEMAHVRRRDVLTQALAAVARAAYWPHPLAWVAARRMEIEREKACDDLVVSRGIDAPAYAQALLEVAVFERSRVMGYAGVGMARASSLEGRIRAVLRQGARRGAVGRRMLVGLVVGALGVTAGLATLSAQTAVQTPAARVAPTLAPATAPSTMPGQAGLTSEDVQKLVAAKEETEKALAKLAAAAGPLSRDAAAAMQDVRTQINEMSRNLSQATHALSEQMTPEERQKLTQTVEALRATLAADLQRAKGENDQEIAALQARLRALDAVVQKEAAIAQEAAGARPAGNVADSPVYYIMGNVQRPGVYSITAKDLTLLQAVAAAGIQDASPESVYIKVVRKQAGKESVAFEGVLSLLMVIGDDVQANDVVSVGAVDEDQGRAAEIGIDTEKIAELRAKGAGADDQQAQALQERIDYNQKALAERGKTAVVSTDPRTGKLAGVRVEALKKP